MERQFRIGIFDSGLGGLTVLREIRRRCPAADLVYLGDTARTPYGSKSVPTIQQYARECARFLMSQEINLLVVACNTASSVALVQLSQEMPFPVVGTIEPAVRSALSVWRGGTIGVIGTDATIASGVYEQMLIGANSSIQVVSRSCPLFVPLVEQGMVQGDIVERVVDLYLKSFRDRPIDTLILACTHYPLLKPVLQQYLGVGVSIVECSTAIADRCLESAPASRASSGGGVRYFVTDTPSRFNYLARELLGEGPVSAEVVEL